MTHHSQSQGSIQGRQSSAAPEAAQTSETTLESHGRDTELVDQRESLDETPTKPESQGRKTPASS
ncbi:MAG: hypothetical protein IGS50_01580 [Synechococcales cyanobacterium C42_A2020_086]|nr:hypothetical protein [Synechococcales cyanobacterium M58_A2018_015]MBF2072443.1 hypothetical protein [Synechococcales cyanobacterium C42_A2020_086]